MDGIINGIELNPSEYNKYISEMALANMFKYTAIAYTYKYEHINNIVEVHCSDIL